MYRVKLKIVSPNVSSILKELEKSFQFTVIIPKNVCVEKKHYYVNISFLFKYSPYNIYLYIVDLGSPSHEHGLFTELNYINIRMCEYNREIKCNNVLKNHCSFWQKLTKLILFKNV